MVDYLKNELDEIDRRIGMKVQEHEDFIFCNDPNNVCEGDQAVKYYEGVTDLLLDKIKLLEGHVFDTKEIEK